MRQRLLIILACASLLGGLASILVYRVVSQVAARAGADGLERVVVATANMSLAETVTKNHVKLAAWPKASVPPGAIRSIESAQGRVVRSSIVAGEPLIEGKLAPELAGKGGIMPMLVPEGQRGVTIKVDEAIKESGFVLPNSRVDVLVSMAKHSGSDEKIAKVILQDVQVLAAGQAVEMRDNKPVTVTTVTLALSPDQSERLFVAQTQGKLMLTMRNLKDKNIVHTPGATPATLLADAGRPAAAPVRTVAAAPPRPAISAALPAPRLQAHEVAVIRGTKVTEHLFVRQDGGQWAEQREPKR